MSRTRFIRRSSVVAAALTTTLIGANIVDAGAATTSVSNQEVRQLERSYQRQIAAAGGQWQSFVTAGDNDRVAIEDEADTTVESWSVNKLAVAVAVLEKVDRGELSLGQRVTLSADIIAEGSGSYLLQTTYGDELTVANIITNMLQVSDNTAVRLLGTLVTGAEVNNILTSKGFETTRVEPLPDIPNRFFLGVTTPRETNTLLTKLADYELISESSTDFMLRIMRTSTVGYTDGVRDNLNAAERGRTAVKYGTGNRSFNEVGVVFDTEGRPSIVYAFFNSDIPVETAGEENPALVAQANLGRRMMNLVDD